MTESTWSGTRRHRIGSISRYTERSTTDNLDRRHRTGFQSWADSPVSTRSFVEQVSSSESDSSESDLFRLRHTESNSDIGTLHGCNVFEVFGVTKLAELNTSSRFSIPGRILVVALSSMSSASFSIHGLLVSQRWSPGYVFPRPEFEIGTAAFLEWLENGAVAFIYFVLGVIFPMLTRHKHVQLERTLSVANRYSWAEAEANLISRYANICFSYVVWSATFVLGMFAPVLIWLPRLYGDDITEQIRVCFWVEVSVFIWSISMLFIGPSRVEEIGTKAVESVVAGVCKELDDMSTESIRWERVLSIVKATDYLLADTFQWSCLGRLVVVRVSMLFSLAAGFGCVGIVHYNEATRKGAMLCGVLSAACGCTVLYRLGCISRNCSNTRPGSYDLAAILIQKMVEHTTEEEDEECRDAFRQLSLYLRERTLGVELLGTRITPTLVANLALRTCFYIPAGVAVIEGIWNKKGQYSGHSRNPNERM